MRKKNLLIDEYPLLVLPSLAKAIGLNEAITLQQLHYWLENPKGGVEMDGFRWVYNTYEDWQKDNFPFWSVRTIMRILTNLENMGLIVSTQKAAYDRKKYYRVHYDNLATWNMPDWNDATCQSGNFDPAKVATSLTEITTETKETTASVDENLAFLTSLYEKNIGMVFNGNLADELQEYASFPRDWIERAFKEMADANVRTWRYVRKCLDSWKQAGKITEKPANGNGSKPGQDAKPAINEDAVEATKRLIEQKNSGQFVPPPPGLRPALAIKTLADRKGVRK